MARCAFIKAGGDRCRGVATRASGASQLCAAHDPDTQARRRAGAAKGGRSSGLAETAEAKRWTKALVAKLITGEVERDRATAAFMGINTLARLIEVERKIREADELEARLEQIEEALDGDGGRTNGGYAWRG